MQIDTVAIPFPAHASCSRAEVSPLASRPGVVASIRAAAPVGPEGAARLVAAGVPGRVSFSEAGGATATNAMAMYRHPADRNAAATGVHAGRVLDVTA